MNWEKSKTLTTLKKDFLLDFFSINNDFFLTGGSALSIFYFDHRYSYDLDLFSEKSKDLYLVNKQVTHVADKIGAKVEKVSTSPLFCRYALSRDGQTEIVDFVLEKVPPVFNHKNTYGNIVVDTLEEIGINKICALVGRSEIKDIVDLYFIARSGFSVTENIENARKKDGGVDPSVLSFLLDQIPLDTVECQFVADFDEASFRDFVSKLKNDLADIAFPTGNV